MQTRRSFFRRLKLRTILLIALLLSGIIPLAISSLLLIPQSREVLSDSEKDKLIRRAETLSEVIDGYLSSRRQSIAQLGSGLLLPPGPANLGERLREPWVGEYLQDFLRNSRDGASAAGPNILALRVLDLEGVGPTLVAGKSPISSQAEGVLKDAFARARAGKAPAYGFVDTGVGTLPLIALAVPVPAGAQGPQMVIEALFRFQPLESLQGESSGMAVFLVDSKGKLLWFQGGDAAMRAGLLGSDLLKAFVRRPMNSITEYKYPSGGKTQEVLAQVSVVGESGWALVAQTPRAQAFAAMDNMILQAILATALLVALAFFFAFMASRWVSLPIQRLADTTHQIAKGSFGGRIEMQGLTFELADLAEDFNRMSGHLESYVQQLRQAAQANRELFIGSLRAFVAAVDAKDPYTRGHSERVASFSRTIARYLQLPEEVQHKIWIGALLHDVGKIGVEDRILRKEGVLAPDEYEQMKMHTVMGADIVAPIEQLKEMIPAIRWHHEAWNGRGYPDGLKGEQIPLFARIVAVADTFDAITTNRPYQQAYSLQFAVETITRLTGSRFDAKIVTAFLRAFEAGEIRAGEARSSRQEPQVELRAAGQR
ncbi:MAG TPA: HD domain-containing phosphohydrolase [Thermoanaerobaculia bacterium]|nr:HD domain-containing phosphohydrolase [Thermoanaerobaculia bacterium]